CPSLLRPHCRVKRTRNEVRCLRYTLLGGNGNRWAGCRFRLVKRARNRPPVGTWSPDQVPTGGRFRARSIQPELLMSGLVPLFVPSLEQLVLRIALGRDIGN